MRQPGLRGRDTSKDKEITRKHGNTLVSTFRKIYGLRFAEGFTPHSTLGEVSAAAYENSLSQSHHDQLHRDHDEGQLEAKIRTHQGS